MSEQDVQSSPKGEKTGITRNDTPRARGKKLPRRAINEHTIAQLAELCVRYQLPEVQACVKLGINPGVWRNFKSRNRNSERWEELISALEADRIADLIDRIDDAARGKNRREPEWRAACYLVQLMGKGRYVVPNPRS